MLAHHLDRYPEASFPLLNSVISRGFTYAVAFHGFDDPKFRMTSSLAVPRPTPL